MSTVSPDTCASCRTELPTGTLYCRDCGTMNLSASNTTTPGNQSRPLLTPFNAPSSRPSAVPAAPRRRPRWFLGTFWAFWALVSLIVGIAGPHKWLILLAIGFGAYSVYLYRGGRYGWFFI